MTRAAQLLELKAKFNVAEEPMPDYFQMPTALRVAPSRTTYGANDIDHVRAVSQATHAELERRTT